VRIPEDKERKLDAPNADPMGEPAEKQAKAMAR